MEHAVMLRVYKFSCKQFYVVMLCYIMLRCVC